MQPIWTFTEQNRTEQNMHLFCQKAYTANGPEKHLHEKKNTHKT